MRLREGHSLGTVKMSKKINPLDHAGKPLHSPAELIRKWVCPGPHPKSLGELHLDKEVPTDKKFSPCTAQNLMLRATARKDPMATRHPQGVQGRLERCVGVFIVCFTWCEGHILQGQSRLEEMLKKLTAWRRFSILFCKVNRARASKRLTSGTKFKGGQKT